MRSRPRHLRSVCIALGVALAVGAGGAAPAVAGTPRATDTTTTVPDDQPLPGYRIENPTLTPAVVRGERTTVRQGVHHHAAYDIEVPPDWNGELVMWAHGYRGQGFVLTVDTPGYSLRQKLLDQGYAWAASSYYDNGYDVRAGVVSTRDLAILFGDLFGRPHRTYIVGVSMGGHVIGRSVEQYPGFYNGALPFCGVMGDHQLFDYFLDYNVVAQALAGVRAYPVPADYLTSVVPAIQVALGLVGLSPVGPDTTNALGKQLRAITINRSGGPRPGADAAFAVWKDFLFGIAVPTSTGTSLAEDPGQLSTNLLTWYRPNEPVNVNATVQRVAPRNLLARFNPLLTQVPIIAGRPSAPVLSVHGLGDLFVPFSMEQQYRRDAVLSGRGHLVIQRAIRTTQHCEFSPAEAGAAWDDLVTWVRGGARPAGDNVTNAAAVADPNFGCRFSDPAAFAAGVGTRRLYAACP